MNPRKRKKMAWIAAYEEEQRLLKEKHEAAIKEAKEKAEAKEKEVETPVAEVKPTSKKKKSSPSVKEETTEQLQEEVKQEE
jgi:hypothetical protein